MTYAISMMGVMSRPIRKSLPRIRPISSMKSISTTKPNMQKAVK